jgi:hypothetical protein
VLVETEWHSTSDFLKQVQQFEPAQACSVLLIICSAGSQQDEVPKRADILLNAWASWVVANSAELAAGTDERTNEVGFTFVLSERGRERGCGCAGWFKLL